MSHLEKLPITLLTKMMHIILRLVLETQNTSRAKDAPASIICVIQNISQLVYRVSLSHNSVM